MRDSIDQNAPVVVDRGIAIDAQLEKVWALLTDVPSWPRWQPDITFAEAAGSLRTNRAFRWSTGGLDIESTVYTIEAPHRILWGGAAYGIEGIHSWTLEPDGDTVRVRTEESWDGPPVLADVTGMQAALEESLTAWLGHLKRAAERP